MFFRKNFELNFIESYFGIQNTIVVRSSSESIYTEIIGHVGNLSDLHNLEIYSLDEQRIFRLFTEDTRLFHELFFGGSIEISVFQKLAILFNKVNSEHVEQIFQLLTEKGSLGETFISAPLTVSIIFYNLGKFQFRFFLENPDQYSSLLESSYWFHNSLKNVNLRNYYLLENTSYVFLELDNIVKYIDGHSSSNFKQFLKENHGTILSSPHIDVSFSNIAENINGQNNQNLEIFNNVLNKNLPYDEKRYLKLLEKYQGFFK